MITVGPLIYFYWTSWDRISSGTRVTYYYLWCWALIICLFVFNQENESIDMVFFIQL